MLDSMKHLSIEEMPIQHIHSKTRTTNFATSIWKIWIVYTTLFFFFYQRSHCFYVMCFLNSHI